MLVGPVVGSSWAARRAMRWIERQRLAHRAHATPIEAGQRARLAAYFEPETLEEIRVREVSRIGPRGMARYGRFLPFTVDFERVYGITFVDTVVMAETPPAETPLAEPDRLACLFHECVHVAQYRLLGVEGFVRRYLAGWAAAGYRYGGIPLEREAYELQRRFATGPDHSFSVELEVRSGAGRLA